jgi:malate dehydrogenase
VFGCGQVVVVANPANTSALILKEMAPSIPAENITALTRLDHNRALALLAEKAVVPTTAVHNAIVW